MACEMFARKIRVDYERNGQLLPCPLKWLDSFSMRNFTNASAFDNTLPVADGLMEIGTSVPLPELKAAMEDWFQRKSYLPKGSVLTIKDRRTTRRGAGRPRPPPLGLMLTKCLHPGKNRAADEKLKGTPKPVWGGHSCPPPLGLILTLLESRENRAADEKPKGTPKPVVGADTLSAAVGVDFDFAYIQGNERRRHKIKVSPATSKPEQMRNKTQDTTARQNQPNPNGGGQECPPHTCLVGFEVLPIGQVDDVLQHGRAWRQFGRIQERSVEVEVTVRAP